MNDLSKTYEPAAVEAEANRVWLDEKCFQADVTKVGEPYSIVIPPPNVTGALHLGHAINNTLQDILIRQHRMAGFNTVWIPGIDHAGIATQAVVEKQLKEKENKTRHDVGREALVERIWAWKQQFGDRILEQLKRLGCSCDWSRTRFTLDDQCAKAVRETFFKLFKDGLIYRGKRLVNWDVHLQTSISDDEIYHETVKTSLWHIRYPISSTGVPPVSDDLGHRRDADATITGTAEPMVKETDLPDGTMLESFPADSDSNLHLSNENAEGDSGLGVSSGTGVSPVSDDLRHRRDADATYMTVATTRPETLLGDTAVAVHSQDSRWNWAIGKFVRLPLTNRLIPIIADDILVDPKFGSGVVKVTPAHDPNDYAVYQRHLGQADAIEILNILNPTGTLNENAGTYAGMKRDAARKKVVEDLTTQGLLAKEEPYETQVGHSDRSKTAVEPYLSDQWFVKMAPLAEPALEVVRDGTIKFFPERHAQQYLSWLGEKRDWPISRQLWWGHRIPVWTTQREFQKRSLRAFLFDCICDWLLDDENFSFVCTPVDSWSPISSPDEPLTGTYRIYLCGSDEQQVRVIFEQNGFEKFTQDPDVLDTWFSSALWPHSTLGWPEKTADLAKWYPTSVLLTGRDIITLWVARMVMMGMYNCGTGVPPVSDDSRHRRDAGATGIPFHHVAINTTILDGRGERMSKSKGNGVDPVDIIDTHGADALRFTLTSMATETQDVRLPVKKDALGRNTSDKFDFGRNFCNKLWNAARFAIGNLETIGGPAGPAAEPLGSVLARESRGPLADRWIVSRFNRSVAEADAALAVYRFDQYARVCYDFFWRDFCDWYVEAIKPVLKDREYSGKTAAVLAGVLDGALRLMHPVIPFITETIWWRLNEVCPSRALPGAPDVHPGLHGKRLILAPWPKAGRVDDAAEKAFALLQEIIVAIRNVRNEYKFDPRKPLVVTLAPTTDAKQTVEENRALVELLATCTVGKVETGAAAPAGTVRAMAGGCEVFIDGLLDAATDKQRIDKQCEALRQKVSALRGRLSNESYAQKAPAHLVQQTRDELAAAEAEMVKLGCS